MPTPFEAGKTAKELGIDITRKFVLVTNPITSSERIRKGDILTFDSDDETKCPWFKKVGSNTIVAVHWSSLAYADPEPEKVKEEYEPQVGDIVQLQAQICKLETAGIGGCHVSFGFEGELDEKLLTYISNKEMKYMKLLSRSEPKPKRKITMKELEELVGEKITIIEE